MTAYENLCAFFRTRMTSPSLGRGDPARLNPKEIRGLNPSEFSSERHVKSPGINRNGATYDHQYHPCPHLP